MDRNKRMVISPLGAINTIGVGLTLKRKSTIYLRIKILKLMPAPNTIVSEFKMSLKFNR